MFMLELRAQIIYHSTQKKLIQVLNISKQISNNALVLECGRCRNWMENTPLQTTPL